MQKIVGDFQVELEMGKPLFGSEEIPLSKKLILKRSFGY